VVLPSPPTTAPPPVPTTQVTSSQTVVGRVDYYFNLKGAQSRFAHIEKFDLNFSNPSFVIRVDPLHP